MSLEFRIEKMDAFRVVGVAIHTTTKDDCCRTEVPTLWGEVINSGKINEISALSNQFPIGLMGINSYNTDPMDTKKFDYYIASATDKLVPEGMVEYMVPATTWAVFPCQRTEIADVEIRIFTEWQLTSGYEVLNTGYETGEMKSQAPDMEVHSQDGTAEVWTAVRKK
jgi:AraC family transcriptional regulator